MEGGCTKWIKNPMLWRSPLQSYNWSNGSTSPPFQLFRQVLIAYHYRCKMAVLQRKCVKFLANTHVEPVSGSCEKDKFSHYSHSTKAPYLRATVFRSHSITHKIWSVFDYRLHQCFTIKNNCEKSFYISSLRRSINCNSLQNQLWYLQWWLSG